MVQPIVYLKSNLAFVNLMRTSSTGICLVNWWLIATFVALILPVILGGTLHILMDNDQSHELLCGIVRDSLALQAAINHTWALITIIFRYNYASKLSNFITICNVLTINYKILTSFVFSYDNITTQFQIYKVVCGSVHNTTPFKIVSLTLYTLVALWTFWTLYKMNEGVGGRNMRR